MTVRSPQAVLFMCGQNSVRSPIAANLLRQLVPRGLYTQSAGVSKAEIKQDESCERRQNRETGTD